VENPASENFDEIGFGSLQYFQLAGLPNVVFDTDVKIGSVYSVYGLCNATSYTLYDQQNAEVNSMAGSVFCVLSQLSYMLTSYLHTSSLCHTYTYVYLYLSN
jgi:hypothetical protein